MDVILVVTKPQIAPDWRHGLLFAPTLRAANSAISARRSGPISALAWQPFGPGVLGRVLTLLLWRRLPILYSAAGDVDHEFGESGGSRGRFRRFLDDASMPGGRPRCQRGRGFALTKELTTRRRNSKARISL